MTPRYISMEQAKTLDSRELTYNEHVSLQLAADGLEMKAVGAEINLSPGTVKNLWHNAAIKLGADNLRHAIAMAFRRGIIK